MHRVGVGGGVIYWTQQQGRGRGRGRGHLYVERGKGLSIGYNRQGGRG